MDFTGWTCSFSRTSSVAPSSSFTQRSCPSLEKSLRLQQVGKWPAPKRGSLQVSNVGWDPEGILASPVPGHISRRSYQRKLETDVEESERLEKQMQKEKEKRRAAREAWVAPETHEGLAEHFLSTEGQEMDFEITRCRPRLKEDFFAYLKSEIGSLRFAMNRTPAMEDKLGELEALQKVLQEGIEAYDKWAGNLVGAKERVARILSAKDKRATLLEMAGENQLDRAVLALLDENIAAATKSNEVQAAQFMEKVRGAVVKYITI